MEMFTIAFCHPVAPVKEHTPRCVRDGLGEVAVLNHVARFQFLGDHNVKAVMVKEFGHRFCDKIKPLTGNNIRLLCRGQRTCSADSLFSPLPLYNGVENARVQR